MWSEFIQASPKFTFLVAALRRYSSQPGCTCQIAHPRIWLEKFGAKPEDPDDVTCRMRISFRNTRMREFEFSLRDVMSGVTGANAKGELRWRGSFIDPFRVVNFAYSCNENDEIVYYSEDQPKRASRIPGYIDPCTRDRQYKIPRFNNAMGFVRRAPTGIIDIVVKPPMPSASTTESLVWIARDPYTKKPYVPESLRCDARIMTAWCNSRDETPAVMADGTGTLYTLECCLAELADRCCSGDTVFIYICTHGGSLGQEGYSELTMDFGNIDKDTYMSKSVPSSLLNRFVHCFYRGVRIVWVTTPCNFGSGVFWDDLFTSTTDEPLHAPSAAASNLVLALDDGPTPLENALNRDGLSYIEPVTAAGRYTTGKKSAKIPSDELERGVERFLYENEHHGNRTQIQLSASPWNKPAWFSSKGTFWTHSVPLAWYAVCMDYGIHIYLGREEEKFSYKNYTAHNFVSASGLDKLIPFVHPEQEITTITELYDAEPPGVPFSQHILPAFMAEYKKFVPEATEFPCFHVIPGFSWNDLFRLSAKIDTYANDFPTLSSSPNMSTGDDAFGEFAHETVKRDPEPSPDDVTEILPPSMS